MDQEYAFRMGNESPRTVSEDKVLGMEMAGGSAFHNDERRNQKACGREMNTGVCRTLRCGLTCHITCHIRIDRPTSVLQKSLLLRSSSQPPRHSPAPFPSAHNSTSRAHEQRKEDTCHRGIPLGSNDYHN